jgi:predicted Zn-dependent protease
MGPSAERRLGDRIVKALYRDPDYIDDPVIMEYVQGIWQPLLAAARQRGELTPEMDAVYAWEVLLGRDRTVNAFALPGAYLGLHLGLVGVVTSRDELASVLAHELSHVTQRHLSRMLTRQGEQAPWLIGAMILGMLAASKSPDAANAMIVGGQAVAAQTQLNFSRDMEREADRVGFGVSTQAGFAPQGFVSMFEKLQQASRLNDAGNFPYLRSHPLTTERMADMHARLALSSTQIAGPTSLEHAMVAARARVLANTTVDALRSWSTQVEPAQLTLLPSAQKAGVLYGALLAAIKLRDFDQAHALWPLLRSSTQADAAGARLTRLLGAEMWLVQGERERALASLQDNPGSTHPAGDPPPMGRAELLLSVQAQPPGAADAATQLLQVWLADHPRDAGAWQLLATTYAAQGRMVGSIRAQAEVNVAQLDYAAALVRFKAAQDEGRKGKSVTDYIEASIVDTRVRQLESTLREQALER